MSADEPALSVRGLRTRQGRFTAELAELDLAVGEVLVLLGTTGAGKTLLLETLAGFHAAEAGSVQLFGRELLGLPPEARRVGVIFQDYALFPHMTVRANIRFGARHAGLSEPETAVREAELTAMLELGELLDRPATELSGGQKQRVGLARALMLRPELLLFDEPLAALDAGLRDRLREELRGLLRRLRQTTVYVTHDRGEAQTLADRVGVLVDGKLLQIGPPADVFDRPASRAVAEFLGVENLLSGTVLDRGAAGAAAASAAPRGADSGHNGTETASKHVRVRVGTSEIWATAPSGPLGIGQPVTVCVQADRVFLSRAGRADGHANRLIGVVERLIGFGATVRVRLRFELRFEPSLTLTATLTRGYAEDLGLTEGAEVVADFRPEVVHLLPE